VGKIQEAADCSATTSPWHRGSRRDVDFLVVKPLPSTKREARLKIRRALSGMGLSKDVVVVTPQEMDRFRQWAGTIVRADAQEGKVLYERAA